VAPRAVVFSIGRGLHKTPRPEVVARVRSTIPNVYVACTQLSEHCAKAVPDSEPTHLSDVYAGGRRRRACCAGTLVLEVRGGTEQLPAREAHRRFIATAAETPLCVD
jgi:competence protein ComEC